GAVDFDDLVRLAQRSLILDGAYLKRLQRRWPYILEDEAQDSSQSQERMLGLLSGRKNWVRVGDPNQAINTTFTTSNPRYLRDFLAGEGVKAFTLNEAGRSAPPIIDLANTLMRWTVNDHPVEDLRSTFYFQEISPTPPGDLQGNPLPDEALIHIHYKPGETISPDKELELVASSLTRWLPEHPDDTVAVLVPENSRGFKLAEHLRTLNLEYDELLRSTTATRDAAQALHRVLDYLSKPTEQTGLSHIYRDVWWPNRPGKRETVLEYATAAESGQEAAEALRDRIVKALSELHEVETFLWPAPGEAALDSLHLRLDSAQAVEIGEELEKFRALIQRWLKALILPIDQLVLTVSQDLFAKAPELALGYKIAQLLRGAGFLNPHWRLPQFVEELRAIAQNERKFLGFDDSEQGFEPKKGRVTIATMHAAKGLEWDRVYLMAVSNYAFPSAQPYDNYISERWFVRDRLNLEAEMLAQLERLAFDKAYVEGDATQRARLDYAAERLRLLYVGITRAKREVVITWNTGRFAAQRKTLENQPALPLVALWEHLTEETGV
ncbi:MAG TPA: ATP-dependent helicase, partial [Aggregatilineales bacterium]|nr:ATP-dependent helicase [Aggregatilineales bacterium]